MKQRPIVHIEISTTDRIASAKFYTELFGWKVEQAPEFNYATFVAEGGPGGGFNSVSENYPAGTIVSYIGTDDIEGDLALAEKLGAKVLMTRIEIPGMGWTAMFLDPFGNKIGLWTEAPKKD